MADYLADFDLPPCVYDPLSVEGLRALARDNRSWGYYLEQGATAEHVTVDRVAGSRPGATVQQFLICYAGKDLVARNGQSTTVEKFYRARLLARRVIQATEGWTSDELPARLPELRRRLGESSGDTPGLCAASVSRAMSMVHRALELRAKREGHAAQQFEAAEPSVPRPPRESLPLRIISEALKVVGGGEQVKIVLVVSGGFSPKDIDALGPGDFRWVEYKAPRLSGRSPAKVRLYYVRITARRPRQRLVRWHPIPLWATPFLDAHLVGTQDALRLPDRTPSLTATFRCLRGRIAGAQPLTASLVKMTWQAAAIAAGMTREVVRHNWGQDRGGPDGWPGKVHRAQKQLLKLALEWDQLDNHITLGLIDGTKVVARRAPSGCPQNAPERGWPPPKRPSALPDTARIRTPPPRGDDDDDDDRD